MVYQINSHLDNVRDSTKVTMYKAIAAKTVPPPTWQVIRNDLRNMKVYTIYQVMLRGIKPYTRWSRADQLNDADNMAILIEAMQIMYEHYIHVEDYTQLVTDLVEITSKNIIGEKDCSETVRMIKERMDEHATACFNRCNDVYDPDDTDLPGSQFYKKIRFQSTGYVPMYFGDNVSYPPSPGWQTTLYDQVQLLYRNYKSTDLDPSVRRFLINQNLGSCGMFTEPKSGSTLMIPFLNSDECQQLLAFDASNQWTSLPTDDPTEADDEYQVHLEERFKSYIFSKRWERFLREGAFRSISASPSATGAHTPGISFGMAGSNLGNSSQSGHQPTTGRPSSAPPSSTNIGTSSNPPPPAPSNPGPPPPPQQPPQPTIPDDTNYEPDLLLIVLAKPFTEKVQAQAPGIKLHDHMDRFNSAIEVPQVISRMQVRYGEGADWTITAWPSSGPQTYVLTYTRQSRKPIFNPVF